MYSVSYREEFLNSSFLCIIILVLEAKIMLDIKNLTITLGDKTILDGLDLHISAGEKIGLVGVNGSGKSTLLKCIVYMVENSTKYAEPNGTT